VVAADVAQGPGDVGDRLGAQTSIPSREEVERALAGEA
ncbi:hypothetical protein K3Z97_27335, partial [Pseudomonas aeruginosa]|nr:hypothetical protein [Pseudomonas aeruginosa]